MVMIKMHTIKINFCGFWNSFKKDNNLFYIILSRHFNVEISNNPDFVICSNRDKPFEYMKYDCVRLMFMGENLSPDFTVFDYVIGFDYLNFSDRYFRLPFAFFFDDAKPWVPEKLTLEQAKEILAQKKYLCNFIYGKKSSHGMRERLFREIEEYKHVVSPGRVLNNTGSSGCTWIEKYKYLEHSKFTIAGDSIVYPGFFTEKIIQPFQHHSIPIYFGNPRISDDINEKAFIWCKSSCDEDVKATVEQVKYIDTHDDMYLEMIMQPPLPSEDYLVQKYEKLEEFLVHIFSQTPEQARRRIRYYVADTHESYLREYMKKHKKGKLIDKTKNVIQNIIKK